MEFSYLGRRIRSQYECVCHDNSLILIFFFNWIEGLFLFLLFCLCGLIYFAFFFVLTHWSIWRAECRFFTLVSLRTKEGNLSLQSRKEKGFHCLLISRDENWTPDYILCSLVLNSFDPSFQSLILFYSWSYYLFNLRFCCSILLLVYGYYNLLLISLHEKNISCV